MSNLLSFSADSRHSYTQFYVECPNPNADVYKFDARICFGKLSDMANRQGGSRGYRRMISHNERCSINGVRSPFSEASVGAFGEETSTGSSSNREFRNQSSNSASLDSSNIVLQGTYLKDTKYIFALVVYTGHETKLALNKRLCEPLKYSQIDKLINKASSLIFCFQLAIAFLMGGAGLLWEARNKDDNLYIYFDKTNSSFFHYFVIPLRFLLLMSFMIPISLKVTLDVAKFFYALLLQWDILIYDKATDTSATALNTDIIEDMGQIDFVLSDKTGTLTDNVMVFKKCSINGDLFGGNTETDSVLNDRKLSALFSATEEEAMFRSPYVEFGRALALCHNVSVESGDAVCSSETSKYKGVSPDEIALVSGVARLGITFESRNSDNTLTLMTGKTEETYELIHLLEFSSERKRCSVIVRVLSGSSAGEIRVYMKGADEMVFPRCVSKENGDNSSRMHLEMFAGWGLRTLVVAYKVILQVELDVFMIKLKKAKESLVSREELVAACYEELESGFNILGVSAIEDKLQEGVTEAISVLRESGVKICMLTGDKYTTAVEIAKSCNLVSPESGREGLLTVEGDNYVTVGSSLNYLIEKGEEVISRHSGARVPVSVVLTGAIIDTVLKLFPLHFLRLCDICETIICCRVTPSQKVCIFCCFVAELSVANSVYVLIFPFDCRLPLLIY